MNNDIRLLKGTHTVYKKVLTFTWLITRFDTMSIFSSKFVPRLSIFCMRDLFLVRIIHATYIPISPNNTCIISYFKYGSLKVNQILLYRVQWQYMNRWSLLSFQHTETESDVEPKNAHSYHKNKFIKKITKPTCWEHRRLGVVPRPGHHAGHTAAARSGRNRAGPRVPERAPHGVIRAVSL